MPLCRRACDHYGDEGAQTTSRTSPFAPLGFSWKSRHGGFRETSAGGAHRCADGYTEGTESVRRCIDREQLDLEKLVCTRGLNFPLSRFICARRLRAITRCLAFGRRRATPPSRPSSRRLCPSSWDPQRKSIGGLRPASPCQTARSSDQRRQRKAMRCRQTIARECPYPARPLVKAKIGEENREPGRERKNLEDEKLEQYKVAVSNAQTHRSCQSASILGLVVSMIE